MSRSRAVNGCRSLYTCVTERERKSPTSSSSSRPRVHPAAAQFRKVLSSGLVGLAWQATITKTETGRFVIILLGHMSALGSALIRKILFSHYKGSGLIFFHVLKSSCPWKTTHTVTGLFCQPAFCHCTIRVYDQTGSVTVVSAPVAHAKLKLVFFPAAPIKHICWFQWIYIALSL